MKLGEIAYLHPRLSQVSRDFLSQVPSDVLKVQMGSLSGYPPEEGMISDIKWREQVHLITIASHVPSVFVKTNENGFGYRILDYGIDFTSWNDVVEWIKDNEFLLKAEQ